MQGPGRVLTQLMDQAGIGENKLARETGVPQPTIHRIKTGESAEPRRTTLMPLAEYFGIDVQEFFQPSSRPKKKPRRDKIDEVYRQVSKWTYSEQVEFLLRWLKDKL